MKISIFGLGYVGGTGVACMAELGHDVLGVDINATKVTLLNAGRSPVFEPGLEELLVRHTSRGAITATTDVLAALEFSEAVIICVGTPPDIHGRLDDQHLHEVIEQVVSMRISENRIIPIIVRSTALPTTHTAILQRIESQLGDSQPAAYCVHPEFLRAGEAVEDFMAPPKIIFGCSDNHVRTVCAELYPDFLAPTIYTDPMTAAFAKYADNSFHAVKITFANEIGRLSRSLSVDPREVMDLFCQDKSLNISEKYLRPGFAFGGSCLPKDLRAALAHGRENMVSTPMLDHVLPSNDSQVHDLVQRILRLNSGSIGMFGLAFKDGTDDLRESPMVTVAETLSGKGKEMRIYDPALRIGRLVGANLTYATDHLPHLAELLVDDPSSMVSESETIIVARPMPSVPWRDLPWRREQVVIDLVGTILPNDLPAHTEGLYW